MRRRKPVGIEGVETGVHLVVGELLLGGVLGLDDRLDRAELAADDASEPCRVTGEDRDERDGRVVLAPGPEHRAEVVTAHQGHVARQDEDLVRVIGHGDQRGPDRVTGPAWLVLQREVGPIVEGRPDRVDGGRIDDDRTARGIAVLGDLIPRVEHIGEHRPAAQRVQHLGRGGAHARAETGGQHDGGRAPGLRVHGRGRRIGTWGVHARRRACTGRPSPTLHP